MTVRPSRALVDKESLVAALHAFGGSATPWELAKLLGVNDKNCVIRAAKQCPLTVRCVKPHHLSTATALIELHPHLRR